MLHIDDLIILSKTWQEHLSHVGIVLKQLREPGLTAKAKKCKFGVRELFILDSGTMKPETKQNSVSASVPTS